MTTQSDIGQSVTGHSDIEMTYRRSARLRANLDAIAPAETRNRSAKFRRALAGEVVQKTRFADIAILPEWISWDDDARDILAKSVAILHHKCAIDMELSGARLAAISEIIGDELFDQLTNPTNTVSAMVQNAPARLPRPEDLHHIGMALMMEGLPASLAHRFPSACGNIYAANLTQIAARICAAHSEEKPVL